MKNKQADQIAAKKRHNVQLKEKRRSEPLLERNGSFSILRIIREAG